MRWVAEAPGAEVRTAATAVMRVATAAVMAVDAAAEATERLTRRRSVAPAGQKKRQAHQPQRQAFFDPLQQRPVRVLLRCHRPAAMGHRIDQARAQFDRKGYLETLRLYLRTIAVQIDWAWVEAAAPEVLINAFSMLAPLRPEEKQALLEAPDLKSRADVLVALAEMELAANGGGTGGGTLQ